MKFLSLLTSILMLAGARAQSAEPAEYAARVKVSALLQTTTTASGQPIQYPKTDHPEVRMFMVEIPPGAETGWHKHPSPAYAYILSGTVSVELESGEKKDLKAGDAFAETVDTMHNGKNAGAEVVKILMVITGETGLPIAQPRAK